MYLMITILIITIALFIWGKYSPDVVALLSMISLFAFGILTNYQIKDTYAWIVALLSIVISFSITYLPEENASSDSRQIRPMIIQ